MINNLKIDLLKDIEFLKNNGKSYNIGTNIYTDLFLTSKYEYKTRQYIKDIISILDIDKSLVVYIPKDIKEKFFEDYNLSIYE